jgi:hypothetical protein
MEDSMTLTLQERISYDASLPVEFFADKNVRQIGNWHASVGLPYRVRRYGGIHGPFKGTAVALSCHVLAFIETYWVLKRITSKCLRSADVWCAMNPSGPPLEIVRRRIRFFQSPSDIDWGFYAPLVVPATFADFLWSQMTLPEVKRFSYFVGTAGEPFPIFSRFFRACACNAPLLRCVPGLSPWAADRCREIVEEMVSGEYLDTLARRP